MSFDRASLEAEIKRLKCEKKAVFDKAGGGLVSNEWVSSRHERLNAQIAEANRKLAANAMEPLAAATARPTPRPATDESLAIALDPEAEDTPASLEQAEPNSPDRSKLPFDDPDPEADAAEPKPRNEPPPNGADKPNPNSETPPLDRWVVLEPVAKPFMDPPLFAGRDKSAGRSNDRRQGRPPPESGADDVLPEPPLPLLWGNETTPALDDVDLVEGVLIERSSVVVYGDSTVGKTFWVTNLALHVATGKPWNGRAVEEAAVVYCNMEGGNRFRNRVAAWRKANPCFDLPFAAVPISLDLLDPNAHVPSLIETIKFVARKTRRPAKLVVIDTLARAMAGGNENSSEDMGALIRNMDIIREATGACVLFIHHCGKDAARGARGHSSLRAAVDTEIEVQADKKTGVRTAKVEKQRDLQDGDVFAFMLEPVVVGQNPRGRDVTTCLVVEAAPPVTEHKQGPKLHEEAVTLWRDIEEIAGVEGRMTRPEPPMPEVLTISRAMLQKGLIKRGWLQVCSVISSSDGEMETLVKGEHSRLWKRLNSLKLSGIIGFNRNDMWLVRVPLMA